MGRYKLKFQGGSPYDLSNSEWVCKKCGGRKRPESPYQPQHPFKRYCKCKHT